MRFVAIFGRWDVGRQGGGRARKKGNNKSPQNQSLNKVAGASLVANSVFKQNETEPNKTQDINQQGNQKLFRNTKN